MNYEVIDIIERNPKIYELLKWCPYEILKRWQVKTVKGNTVLMKQGEVYNSFLIIVDGLVDIFIMSEQGKKYSQAIYKKGDYIGELEIFEKMPYSCFVETITDAVVLSISRDDFLKWIDMDHNINRYITKTLCRQFYTLSLKAGEDTLYTLRQRICKYILSNISRINNDYIVAMDKFQISEQMAVTPRSVNRILKQLKEESIIQEGNGYIKIIDIDKLKF